MRFAGWSGASTAGRRTLPEDRLPVHRTGGEAMVEGVEELGVAVGEVGEGGVPLGTGLPADLGEADAGVGGVDRLEAEDGLGAFAADRGVSLRSKGGNGQHLAGQEAQDGAAAWLAGRET